LRSQADDIHARFCVGKAYLDRGRVDEGLGLLESVLALDPLNRLGHSDKSLFVLGRYYARVKGQHDIARHLFRELDARFASSEYGAGAAWWYARSLQELGQIDLATDFLRARAQRLNTTNAIVEYAEFTLRVGLDHERALKLVTNAQKRVPRNKELRELQTRLQHASKTPQQ
jgi:tetratricopeptide (TPR) repeat protein